jgi:hypothetical protein
MTAASRAALVFQLVAAQLASLAVSASPARGQDACPLASGADAEAGWAAYGAGDMDAARARFDAALARCPDDHYARTGLGYVLLGDGDVPAATALWTAWSRYGPTTSMRWRGSGSRRGAPATCRPCGRA